jgi:micrococcal nuclease
MKLLFILLLLISTQIFAKSKTRHSQKIKSFQAQIINCNDGDTCRAQYKDQKIKIRFSGIDAPEIKQPEGKLSKKYLNDILSGQIVQLECNGKSYDRLTCLVFLNEVEINQQLVDKGFAFDSPKYSKGKYQQAMLQAQSAKLGIWKTIETSPYCTRHANNAKCKKDSLYNQ